MINTANTDATRYVDTWSSIAACVGYGVIGGSVLMILPVMVGELISDLQLFGPAVGWVASTDMAGAVVGAFIISTKIHVWNRRRILAVAALVLTALNLASVFAASLEAVVATRLICGIAEGAILAAASSILAGTQNPDRNFGFFIMGQLTFGSLAFLILPAILSMANVDGLFIFLAFVSTSGLALVFLLPATVGIAQYAEADKTLNYDKRRASMGLTAVLVFFCGAGMIWAYLERVGVGAGLSRAEIGTALAISGVFGILGALTPTLVGLRVGRIRPLVVGFVLLSSSIALLVSSSSYVMFAAAAVLFNYAWNLSIPYELGLLAEIDPGGRTVGMSNAAGTAGIAIGPAIGATVVKADNFQNVNLLAIGFFFVSLLLFTMVVRSARPTA